MIGIILVLLLLLVANVMITSLNMIAVAGIVTALLYKWPKLFDKAVIWYSIALVVAVLSAIFYTEQFTKYIVFGYVPYALFLIVMMVGVFPNNWTLARNIKRHRGTLSIVGFILISPHAFLHVFDLFDGINLFGIVAYVIMVPLTIISFRVIRREINPKDWFRVQKAAYVIYGMLFAHLLWVGDWVDKVIYAILMTLYFNNKLLKEFRK